MKTKENDCVTESEEKLSSNLDEDIEECDTSENKVSLPLLKSGSVLSISADDRSVENDGDSASQSDSLKLNQECRISINGELSEYDNCESETFSVVTEGSQNIVISSKKPIEVEGVLPVEENCQNSDENADEVSSLLNKSSDLNKKASVDGTSAIVLTDGKHQIELIWKRVMEEHKDKRAKEAVAILGQHRTYEKSSPFRYKSWLLRLSHRKRFEILIATGIFLWLAFFIALAIFMNGPSKPEDLKDGAMTDRTPSGMNPSVHKPAIDEILQKQAKNYSFETTPFQSPTVTESIKTTTNTINNGVKSTLKHESTTETPTSKSISSVAYGLDPVSTIETLLKSTNYTQEKSTAVTNEEINIASSSAVYQANSTVATSLNSENFSSPNIHTSSSPINLSEKSGTTEISDDATRLFSMMHETKMPVVLDQLLKGKEPEYEVGVGRADITGPPADVNMMGYANPSQTAGGIHMRQYARAFIVSRDKSRVAFVSIDACMGSTLVKLEVLKVLKSHYGELYTADNLCISGTHTHSAPAGFLQDVLFQITSMGYVPETLQTMVNGIVESIHIAHRQMVRGYILINKGELLGSNINRSPIAYLNNPSEERKRYKYNVDKEMTLLKFLDEKGNGIGSINWFPVHCTSMNNTNSLISGDNKGYAELLMEQEMDPGSLQGQSKFVAAFAQSNEGDVSPNTKGPHCIDTGLPCDNFHSTCNGKVQNCIAIGPGKDMFESTKIIAENQFKKAVELYKEASVFLTGPLQAVQQFIDMTNQTVPYNSTHSGHTCKPAMGFSFAAGTTDGPGAFDFKQGDKSGNTFWKVVRNFLHSPSKDQTECHYPKPILLDTGEMMYPYSWQPNVVDTQIFRIGQLLISAVPGEFTTMSGRRLRDGVFKEFSKAFPSEKFESVIAGLSNTYSDYITTFEEYHVQRYEGASTIFGPHTLGAYVQQFKKLASSMIYDAPLSGATEAHDLLPKLMSFVPGVVMDSTPYGYDFGDLLRDANKTYVAGDVVTVQFVAGNPRNSPTANMTFLTVERQINNDTWKVVKTDTDWDTKYIWERTLSLGKLRGLSETTVKFDTSSVTSSGRYRINHYGHYKYFWNRKIYPYHGRSKEFYVLGKDSNS